MESKLKQAAQDSVGELPAGYLHLPTTPINQNSDNFGASVIGSKEYKNEQQRKNQRMHDALESMPIKQEPQLTDWIDGSKFVPYHVGEYSANTVNSRLMKRWWNGKWWSYPYTDDSSNNEKRLAKMKKEDYPNAAINFQGLSSNPNEVQS